MAYVVQASEKVRGIGAKYETKAMLYLLNCREDSSEINLFAIDFFNDVTGLNLHTDKSWDIQSKGTKSGGPKNVGKELVTLFKNYMSELHFNHLILFMAAAPETLRKNNLLTTFGIENVKEHSLKSLKDGLVQEAMTKTYIENDWITNENIEAFINKVIFVVDDRSEADYIRGIITVNPKYIPEDKVLDGIFNKIRDVQAGKKNNESVEGTTISRFSDVMYYDRMLKSKEIRLMVLNTFINYDVMNTSPPPTFYQLIHRFDGLKQKDIIEDCKLQISTLLYDKTFTDQFWDLLNLICETVVDNKTLAVKDIFDLIATEPQVNNQRLDALTIQYLISVLKEALQ